MSCHGSNKDNHGSHKHSPLKHMLHMVLCCGLPLLIVSFLPLVAKYSPGAGRFLASVTPFICPIMMITMIPMMLMGQKKSSCCEDGEKEDASVKALNQPAE